MKALLLSIDRAHPRKVVGPQSRALAQCTHHPEPNPLWSLLSSAQCVLLRTE